MTLIADITVPADRFELGRIFQEFPEIHIEFEQFVPLQEAPIPLLWISGIQAEQAEATLNGHRQIRAVDVLSTAHGATLIEVEWTADLNGFVQSLMDTQANMLEATGNAENWDFRLRFRSHEQLSRFNQRVTRNGIPVTLRHLSNPMIHDDEPQLSSEQRTALIQAYHRGYFEIPRHVRLKEIAEDMEISDSALSQRVRRGITTLIEQTILADESEKRSQYPERRIRP